MKLKLKVDPLRIDLDDTTGIKVRADGPDGKLKAYDIATLTKESLLEWLRSNGGDNLLAETTVCILLGHGSLHSEDDA